ncbi:Transglycosylase-like domain protein [Streptococcus infantarius subsp. infantarius]|nr:Transglycosylase-like domain protein [Streptococcus infantarius subsp. infantarius]MCO4526589.1 Transglycosylase-like domain protein [Streptococcus infantarius subsp. infantarius]
MYSRITKAKHRKIRNIIVSILGAILVVAMVVVLIPKIEAFAETITTRSEAGAAKAVSTSSESSEVSSTSISSTTAESEESSSSSSEETEEVEASSTEEVQESEASYAEVAPANDNTTIVAAATAPSVASNGNTAGAVGSDAAAQMAAATGVPQSTWEAIIARESNGDPTVANASGASGLFQTMPGWGSTATVQDQIATAIKVYNTQGLSAWEY